MDVLYIYIYLHMHYYMFCSESTWKESHHCLFKSFRPISLHWLANKCNLTTNILFLIICFIIDALLELLLILTKCHCMRFSPIFMIYTMANDTISKDMSVFYRFPISFQLWNWITFIFPLHYHEKRPLEHAFCIRTGNMRIPIQYLLNIYNNNA